MNIFLQGLVFLPIILNNGAPADIGQAISEPPPPSIGEPISEPEPENHIGWPEADNCDGSQVNKIWWNDGEFIFCNPNYSETPFSGEEAEVTNIIGYEDGSARLNINGQETGYCVWPHMGCTPEFPEYPGDIEEDITDAVGIDGPVIPGELGHGEGWIAYEIVAYDEYDYPVVRRWTVSVYICTYMDCGWVTIYLTPLPPQ